MIEKWQPIVGLSEWEIKVLVSDIFSSHGSSTAEPRYRQLTLTFNPKRIEEDDLDLEELVIHELVHALTWRLWEFAEQMLTNYGRGSDYKPMKWMLEEIHEESVTAMGWALVKAGRNKENIEHE